MWIDFALAVEVREMLFMEGILTATLLLWCALDRRAPSVEKCALIVLELEKMDFEAMGKTEQIFINLKD